MGLDSIEGAPVSLCLRSWNAASFVRVLRPYTKDALLLGALLAEYVAMEERIGHTFQHGKPLVQIQKALTAGHVPRKVDSTLWNQCA